MADVSTPEDRRAGILRLTFGGEERTCPTLKLRASREWLRASTGRLPLLLDALGLDSDMSQATFVDFSYELGLDVIAEYDCSGTLGDRAWFEEHADPFELYEALRAMARVAVPFGNDLQSLVAILITMVPDLFERPAPEDESQDEPDAGSGSTRSTPTPSAPGTSTPRRSRRPSTPRS